MTRIRDLVLDALVDNPCGRTKVDGHPMVVRCEQWDERNG